MPVLSTVSLPGSVLLQVLLQFQDTSIIVNSLLDMKSSELKTLACDPSGSRVYDVIMFCAAVNEKCRNTLINKLKVFTFSELFYYFCTPVHTRYED